MLYVDCQRHGEVPIASPFLLLEIHTSVQASLPRGGDDRIEDGRDSLQLTGLRMRTIATQDKILSIPTIDSLFCGLP